MPAPPTLYAFAAEGRPYVRAAIVACTNPIPAAAALTLAGLGEPTTPGYARYESVDLAGLFESIRIVGGRMVGMVSRLLNWRNLGGAAQPLTGVALVIWETESTPLVMTAVNAATVWAPGTAAAGRLYVSAIIHDQEA